MPNIPIKLPFWKKVTLAIALATFCTVGVYYFFVPRASIVDYHVARDKTFILSLFDRDWYWLSGYDREEVDTDLFLERMSPYNEPRYVGKLIIKVMRVDKEPVGFIAYYMKSSYEGVILFLDIAHGRRRHQYGRALLDYAVKELTKKGAYIVRLVTRTENIPAQKLYTKAGFKEDRRNDTYVFFSEKT